MWNIFGHGTYSLSISPESLSINFRLLSKVDTKTHCASLVKFTLVTDSVNVRCKDVHTSCTLDITITVLNPYPAGTKKDYRTPYHQLESGQPAHMCNLTIF